MATPISAGTTNWDVPANANFVSLQSQATAQLNNSNWGPTDTTSLAWTMDPATVGSGSTQLSNGVLIMSLIKLRSAATITSLVSTVSVAGTSLTSNQCWAGLYNFAGTLLGSSSNQSTTWNSVGTKVMNLTSPVAVAAGSYFTAWLTNGSGTIPSFRSTGATSSSMINYGTTSPGRFIQFGAGQTVLPASFTPGSATQSSFGIWAAFA